MFEREKTSKEEIIVIYDNSVYKAGLENDWGFSCVIKKKEKQYYLILEKMAVYF